MSALLLAAVLGCSSCGTGGDDPLILYPADRMRLYLGAGTTRFDGNIVADGSERGITGVRERQKLLFSFGSRVTRDSFVTLAVPQVTNVGADDSRSGAGDPALGFRYTVVQQDFTEPLRPQVQILAGVKLKAAASTYNAEDQREFLDAFGTGFTTWRAGFDIWSAMTTVNYGVAYNMVYANPAVYGGETIKPGNAHSANVTVGGAFGPAGQMRAVTGIVRNQKQQLTIDGAAVADSVSVQHNLFVTASWRPAPLHEVRLTVVDEGRVLTNVNTTRGRSYTGAYILTL
jgi:hypothetical protein